MGRHHVLAHGNPRNHVLWSLAKPLGLGVRATVFGTAFEELNSIADPRAAKCYSLGSNFLDANEL